MQEEQKFMIVLVTQWVYGESGMLEAFSKKGEESLLTNCLYFLITFLTNLFPFSQQGQYRQAVNPVGTGRWDGEWEKVMSFELISALEVYKQM